MLDAVCCSASSAEAGPPYHKRNPSVKQEANETAGPGSSKAPVQQRPCLLLQHSAPLIKRPKPAGPLNTFMPKRQQAAAGEACTRYTATCREGTSPA